MRVLVIGGAGYIGSHACKALAQAGHRPIVLDDLSTGHAEAVRWGPLELCDLRDERRLRAVFEEHRPEAVMHFAALAYVGESVRRPADYYQTNVAGTISLLQAMIDHGVSQIVFSSSCAIYGAPEISPIDEATPLRPINPYGFTKLACEQMLADYARAYRLRWVALRYFNAAGADPGGELAEDHEPETHVVPLAIQAALGAQEFKLFGEDYPTPDGTAVRDYVHVSDLADAHTRALAHLERGGASCAFNLATGAGHSVRDVLGAVSRQTRRPIQVTVCPRRDGDPPVLVADARRAHEVLGWRPRLSRLDDMVASALAARSDRPAAASRVSRRSPRLHAGASLAD